MISALRPSLWREIKRRPVIDILLAKEKAFRQDTQDLGLRVVQQDRAAYNGPVSAEPALPQAITQKDELFLGLVFLECEDAADDRLHSKNVKEVRGHTVPEELLRRSASGQAHAAALPRSHV